MTEELNRTGALLANVAFNLAQKPGHALTSDDVALLDKLRRQWDEACRAALAAPSVPSGEPADLVALMDLADDYAEKLADAHAERMYGTSHSYTKQCIGNANKARTALHNALAAAPAAPGGEG